MFEVYADAAADTHTHVHTHVHKENTHRHTSSHISDNTQNKLLHHKISEQIFRCLPSNHQHQQAVGQDSPAPWSRPSDPFSSTVPFHTSPFTPVCLHVLTSHTKLVILCCSAEGGLTTAGSAVAHARACAKRPRVMPAVRELGDIGTNNPWRVHFRWRTRVGSPVAAVGSGAVCLPSTARM